MPRAAAEPATSPPASAAAGSPRSELSPGKGGLLSRCLRAFVEPIGGERRQRNRERWDELPSPLRQPHQVMGRWHHACGATHGVMERCDFACTSCYLSAVANATPALPEAEVRSQLDALRCWLGPQGKTQITSGEVTLLPVETLGGYVAYARRIGLDPMVMTHGQRLLDDPGYLERLVAEYGLRKLAVHVDSTQRGRRGWRPGLREEELHDVREAYAELIRRTRRRTGRTLYAAHTVTVTADTVGEVPAVARWVRDNADAFRMVSFQPTAPVGRTQDAAAGLDVESVWDKVCEGLGQRVNARPLLYGHPECNVVVPVVVVGYGDETRIVELSRRGARWDRAFFARLLDGWGGFSHIGDHPLVVAARVAGLARRNLPLLLEAPFYAVHRLWGVRQWLPAALWALLRGRLTLRPLALVVHRFMGADELATPSGRERLAACVFKLPVDGQMISMCEMNASGLRRTLDEARRRGPRSPEETVPAPGADPALSGTRRLV